MGSGAGFTGNVFAAAFTDIFPDFTAISYCAAAAALVTPSPNGRTTVPQIFIDGRHIGGCDDLMALEYDGKLDALLAA